jgi:hypothetical protein
MKKNSLKWPKMTRNTLKSKNLPKSYPKNEKMTLNLKMSKNDKKITYKIYISVTSSSYPRFTYLRASHRIQGKKMTCHQNRGPGHDSLRLHNHQSVNAVRLVLFP